MLAFGCIMLGDYDELIYARCEIRSDNLKQQMAFFESGKRGQISELHDALNSKNFEDKKMALKKVIAQMTLGKDLSPLFQSVLKCLEYSELDIKKLVYLYIINYSRSKPDEAIMTISSFRKDAANKSNPIIRALAVRTMSSLRVPKLNEYLVEPLKIALNDEDPYVRKTAVLSIPKVYEIAPNDAETNNLVGLLEVLVTKESNGLVLANAIASLQEIAILSGRVHIRVDQQLLSRILVAINECMEWAQVFILDFLSKYSPKDQKEAEMIIDRVIPRLSHINPAVVFGSIRLIVRYLDFLSNEDLIKNLIKKLAPSIVSVVSFTSVETQYVVLKNIQYIIEKRPSILENEIKCFFCKFSDPYYVKNQKIQILTRIINYKNYQSVLDEIKQYLNQLDSQFVKKCIRAVGKITIRYEKSVEKCMGILAKVVKEAKDAAEHAQQLINELLITMQNILRKYPSKYNFDGMFLDLVSLLDHATDSESKVASVWILAEYAEEIYNVSMATFKKWIANFQAQDRKVQLEILSSAVKVYLKYPDEFESLISDLLTVATENVNNPDVRDRAFIYWRMLSTDPEKTKTVVFGYRPQAKDNDKLVDQTFLSDMMKSMGYASSLFEKRPEELFQRSLAEQKGIKIEPEEDAPSAPEPAPTKNPSPPPQQQSKSNPPTQPVVPPPTVSPPKKQEKPKEDNLIDLL